MHNAVVYIFIQQPGKDDLFNVFHNYFRHHEQLGQSCLRRRRRRSKDIVEHHRSVKIALLGLITALMKKLNEDQPDDIIGYVVTFLDLLMSQRMFGGMAIKSLCEKEYPSNMNIIILGLAGVGKSTLLAKLKGKENRKYKPTCGFRPVKMKMNDSTVQFYDLGGGESMRQIWENYYYDVHAIIFVFDASASNKTFKESMRVFETTIGHRYLVGKPLLCFCNKVVDIPGSRSVEDIRSEVEAIVTSCLVIGASLYRQHRMNSKSSFYYGLMYLFDTIADNVDSIESRISIDTKKEKNQVLRAKASRFLFC